MIAVRDNEDMAAASTVAASRIKVLSFAISGGIAALGGCLLVTLREQVTPTQAFAPEESLRVVATAVIGGLGSIAGPVIGALWVRGLPVLFSDTPQVRLFTSSIGLLILLMYFPGGLMQIMYKLRDGVLDWADRRLADRGVQEPVPAIAKRVPTRVAARERGGCPGLVARGARRQRQLRRHSRGRQRVARRASGRAGRAHRHERRRQVDAHERDRRIRAVDAATSTSSGAM